MTKPGFGEHIRRFFQPFGAGGVEVDDFGDQQRLPLHALQFALGLHALQHQSFVGRMLVDDDEAAFCLGNDVVGVQLGFGGAQRESARVDFGGTALRRRTIGGGEGGAGLGDTGGGAKACAQPACCAADGWCARWL